jgi:hypothetical protein
MVSAVGSSAYGVQSPSGMPSGTKIAALEGRVQQAEIQLNDWTTCVSAKTSKGQAAIQKLSGEVSATKEQIARAQQIQSGAPSPLIGTSAADAQGAKAALSLNASVPRPRGSVDTWA